LALLLAVIKEASMQSVEDGQPLGEKKEIIFTIEHAIGGRDFVHRSTIHLIKQPDGKQGLLFPEKNGVFGDDMKVVKEMLEKNELYTIRIKSQVGNVSSSPLISSLPLVRQIHKMAPTFQVRSLPTSSLSLSLSLSYTHTHIHSVSCRSQGSRRTSWCTSTGSRPSWACPTPPPQAR
jgi:hypothetical protein